VVAQKKVKKFQQVVLKTEVPGLGPAGTLSKVPNGYLRNFLTPQGLAVPATPGILQQIQKEKDAQSRKAGQVKEKAQSMATALATIGKFVIKKKVGENDRIFGSVTPQEVSEAVYQQTGRQINKEDIEVPDIKTTGSFDVSAKLHPEVTGKFKVVVQREKNK
jgi:large subunit ribosomal protein L9